MGLCIGIPYTTRIIFTYGEKQWILLKTLLLDKLKDVPVVASSLSKNPFIRINYTCYKAMTFSYNYFTILNVYDKAVLALKLDLLYKMVHQEKITRQS